MKISTLPLIALLFAAVLSTSQGQEMPTSPVVPGLYHKNPLTEAQSGEVLMAELRCASCHEGMNGVGMKAAPDLKNVGARLQLDYMQRFIADPAAMHSGTSMPSLLTSETEENRRMISESISYYLLSLQSPAAEFTKLSGPDWSDGRNLYQSIGCVACHSPRNEAGKEISPKGQISLAHISKKYQADGLTDFLFEPLKVRPSGRMPDMNLSKGEATALSIYLMSDAVATTPQKPEVKNVKPTAAQVEEGKKNFKKFNCVACHQVDGPDLTASKFGPPLSKINSANGCLSEQPKTAPNFHLDASQVKSIRAALTDSAPSNDDDKIKMRLTQLNCIACHQRDDYGGVRPDLDSLFVSTEAALGNEARIPPQLTLVGAKLRPEWLNQVLYDRQRVRPYMTTRMPQFGEAALNGLPALFAKVDHLPAVDVSEPEEGPLKKSMNEGATQLLGDKGLNCIACHNYNGTESPGMKGLDLMTTYQRLQPAWFFQYMKNPARFRPGIIMPSYWPDGKAVQTEILNGDTDLQLRALMFNFSLGRSARDPSGLRSAEIKLTVKDKTLMHRGRGRTAGFRGIAVGLSGGLSYAFNAQNGAIAAVWQGDFINVNWRQQGAGDFNPIGKVVSLPQDVSFLPLTDPKAPWPLLPVTSKEQPVNPDPLYPSNHGYKYLGYNLDATDTPTFRYRSGDILITDFSVSAPVKSTLQRTLTFLAEAPQTLYFRVLTGKIESVSSTTYKTAGLQLTLSKGETLLRPFAGKDGEQELLIKLPLIKGSSTLTIGYTLQP
jgi:mono/diheme cytochrome c family protein